MMTQVRLLAVLVLAVAAPVAAACDHPSEYDVLYDSYLEWVFEVSGEYMGESDGSWRPPVFSDWIEDHYGIWIEPTNEVFAWDGEGFLLIGCEPPTPVYDIEASVRVSPAQLNLAATNGVIQVMIDLPEGWNESDIDPNNFAVNGVPIALVNRSVGNGTFVALFPREEFISALNVQTLDAPAVAIISSGILNYELWYPTFAGEATIDIFKQGALKR